MEPPATQHFPGNVTAGNFQSGPQMSSSQPPPGVPLHTQMPPQSRPPLSSAPPTSNTQPPAPTGGFPQQPNSMLPPLPSSTVTGNLPQATPSSLSNSIYNQNYPQNTYQVPPPQQPPPTSAGSQPPPPQNYNFNTPPSPGMTGYPSGPVPRAPTPSGPMSAPAQPRKLDPDQMPSPVSGSQFSWFLK